MPNEYHVHSRWIPQYPDRDNQPEPEFTEELKTSIAEFETVINGELTVEKARALADQAVALANVTFETGTQSQADLVYELFRKLTRRMFALGRENREETNSFWEVFKRLKTYENFVTYGRKSSGNR